MNDDLNDYLNDFYESARRELFPKMKDSSLSVTIFNSKPDPKLCMEIGAAILFDKPIIVVVPDETMLLPATLARVASKIVYGSVRDPGVMERLQDAITAVLPKEEGGTSF